MSMTKKPHKGSGSKKTGEQKARRKPHRSERQARRAQRSGTHEKGEPPLPDTLVITVDRLNDEGEAIAIPTQWDRRHKPPHIIITGGEAPAINQRALARLHRVGKHAYEANIIKLLAEEKP